MTTFESNVNIDNEQKVADAIQNHVGNSIKVSESLDFDYYIDRVLFENDGIVAWIEIKCTDTYEYCMSSYYKISLKKIKRGIDWGESTSAPFYLAVNFKDGIFITRITKECMKNYPIGWGGRKVRRVKGDQEPMIAIPISEFVSLRNFTIDKVYY